MTVTDVGPKYRKPGCVSIAMNAAAWIIIGIICVEAWCAIFNYPAVPTHGVAVVEANR